MNGGILWEFYFMISTFLGKNCVVPIRLVNCAKFIWQTLLKISLTIFTLLVIYWLDVSQSRNLSLAATTCYCCLHEGLEGFKRQNLRILHDIFLSFHVGLVPMLETYPFAYPGFDVEYSLFPEIPFEPDWKLELWNPLLWTPEILNLPRKSAICFRVLTFSFARTIL